MLYELPDPTEEGEGGGASAAERIAAEFSGALPEADGSLDADAGHHRGISRVFLCESCGSAASAPTFLGISRCEIPFPPRLEPRVINPCRLL